MELWQSHRSEGHAEARDPRAFAPFLAGREVAQEHPALPDLARLDLGLFLAGLTDREPSIGACCLPAGLIAAHPDLMLRLQSSFRYLSLTYPVQTWVAADGALPTVPADHRILLRLSPDRSGSEISVARDLLSPARFTFESSLARGRTFVAATKSAALQDPAFDGLIGIASLVEEGAIADVILHAKP